MKEISEADYYDRVYGSWLGRVAGDFVGAPVEFRPYRLIKRKYGEITHYLKEIDLDYVNDDEMYEICALIALEEKGANVTTADIAKKWADLLYTKNYTAEKIALRNIRRGVMPPESGIKDNYYYDAIGAQMRADIWGQITPGCPEIAKEYAQMDGSISHAGIGIEGEIFIACLISNAFFEKNIAQNIQNSLKFLPSPEKSRYTRMIKTALSIFNQYPNDFRKARKSLIQYWYTVRKELREDSNLFSARRIKFLNQAISGVHVLPNAGIIILSLLYGAKKEKDQLGRSICVAAMMGLDTDCNCGNIGAILGAQLGAKKIPIKWKEPLQDTFSTFVKGHEKWKLSELSKRIFNIGKEIVAQKCADEVLIK